MTSYTCRLEGAPDLTRVVKTSRGACRAAEDYLETLYDNGNLNLAEAPFIVFVDELRLTVIFRPDFNAEEHP